jgi:hypothetical protein
MADEAVVDPEAIKAELATMKPEHVEALYMAAKEVLFAHKAASAPAVSAMPAAATPPAASPDSPPPPAMKMEMGSQEKGPEANGGQVKAGEVIKSEDRVIIEELQKKLQETDALASGLLNIVEKVILVAPRKAVTSLSEIKKSETKVDLSSLSREEVRARLGQKARTNLSKSDRELINHFEVGAIGVDKVEHLLS